VRKKNNQQIGKQLCITSHTVKAHVASILGKYEMKNRAELAYNAIKNNWI